MSERSVLSSLPLGEHRHLKNGLTQLARRDGAPLAACVLETGPEWRWLQFPNWGLKTE